MARSKSAVIRAALEFPVIDSDAHHLEFEPALIDAVKKVAGSKVAQRLYETSPRMTAGRMSVEERKYTRTPMAPWWSWPTLNTLDRATATFPKLMYERMDETGIDFAVIYPSVALGFVHHDDEEVRRAACRGFNQYYLELFREFQDRMTPVGVIPMHTPEEAIEELEYAVGQFGIKAVLMPSYVRRPIPKAAREYPELLQYACWEDTFGLESDYDYDPVWAKCVELQISPTFHSNKWGWAAGPSISNRTFNNMGNFMASGEAISRSLFLGGVTRRFPSLKFAFLEGGVDWGRRAFSQQVSFWSKRNGKVVTDLDPSKADLALLTDLARRYGGKAVEGRTSREELRDSLDSMVMVDPPEVLDDWAACGIQKAEEIIDLFVRPFYFGCEGDDPTNATAYDSNNPFGVSLNAIYGSDIGHWDLPDISKALEEAYENVEHGNLSQDNFQDLVFTTPVELWAGTNPNFFQGTVMEKQVATLLAGSRGNRVFGGRARH